MATRHTFKSTSETAGFGTGASSTTLTSRYDIANVEGVIIVDFLLRTALEPNPYHVYTLTIGSQTFFLGEWEES